MLKITLQGIPMKQMIKQLPTADDDNSIYIYSGLTSTISQGQLEKLRAQRMQKRNRVFEVPLGSREGSSWKTRHELKGRATVEDVIVSYVKKLPNDVVIPEFYMGESDKPLRWGDLHFLQSIKPESPFAKDDRDDGLDTDSSDDEYDEAFQVPQRRPIVMNPDPIDPIRTPASPSDLFGTPTSPDPFRSPDRGIPRATKTSSDQATVPDYVYKTMKDFPRDSTGIKGRVNYFLSTEPDHILIYGGYSDRPSASTSQVLHDKDLLLLPTEYTQFVFFMRALKKKFPSKVIEIPLDQGAVSISQKLKEIRSDDRDVQYIKFKIPTESKTKINNISELDNTDENQIQVGSVYTDKDNVNYIVVPGSNGGKQPKDWKTKSLNQYTKQYKVWRTNNITNYNSLSSNKIIEKSWLDTSEFINMDTVKKYLILGFRDSDMSKMEHVREFLESPFSSITRQNQAKKIEYMKYIFIARYLRMYIDHLYEFPILNRSGLTWTTLTLPIGLNTKTIKSIIDNVFEEIKVEINNIKENIHDQDVNLKIYFPLDPKTKQWESPKREPLGGDISQYLYHILPDQSVAGKMSELIELQYNRDQQSKIIQTHQQFTLQKSVIYPKESNEQDSYDATFKVFQKTYEEPVVQYTRITTLAQLKSYYAVFSSGSANSSKKYKKYLVDDLDNEGYKELELLFNSIVTGERALSIIFYTPQKLLSDKGYLTIALTKRRFRKTRVPDKRPRQPLEFIDLKRKNKPPSRGTDNDDGDDSGEEEEKNVDTPFNNLSEDFEIPKDPRDPFEDDKTNEVVLGDLFTIAGYRKDKIPKNEKHEVLSYIKFEYSRGENLCDVVELVPMITTMNKKDDMFRLLMTTAICYLGQIGVSRIRVNWGNLLKKDTQATKLDEKTREALANMKYTMKERYREKLKVKLLETFHKKISELEDDRKRERLKIEKRYHAELKKIPMFKQQAQQLREQLIRDERNRIKTQYDDELHAYDTETRSQMRKLNVSASIDQIENSIKKQVKQYEATLEEQKEQVKELLLLLQATEFESTAIARRTNLSKMVLGTHNDPIQGKPKKRNKRRTFLDVQRDLKLRLAVAQQTQYYTFQGVLQDALVLFDRYGFSFANFLPLSNGYKNIKSISQEVVLTEHVARCIISGLKCAWVDTSGISKENIGNGVAALMRIHVTPVLERITELLDISSQVSLQDLEKYSSRDYEKWYNDRQTPQIGLHNTCSYLGKLELHAVTTIKKYFSTGQSSVLHYDDLGQNIAPVGTISRDAKSVIVCGDDAFEADYDVCKEFPIQSMGDLQYEDVCFHLKAYITEVQDDDAQIRGRNKKKIQLVILDADGTTRLYDKSGMKRLESLNNGVKVSNVYIALYEIDQIQSNENNDPTSIIANIKDRLGIRNDLQKQLNDIYEVHQNPEARKEEIKKFEIQYKPEDGSDQMAAMQAVAEVCVDLTRLNEMYLRNASDSDLLNHQRPIMEKLRYVTDSLPYRYWFPHKSYFNKDNRVCEDTVNQEDIHHTDEKYQDAFNCFFDYLQNNGKKLSFDGSSDFYGALCSDQYHNHIVVNDLVQYHYSNLDVAFNTMNPKDKKGHRWFVPFARSHRINVVNGWNLIGVIYKMYGTRDSIFFDSFGIIMKNTSTIEKKLYWKVSFKRQDIYWQELVIDDFHKFASGLNIIFACYERTDVSGFADKQGNRSVEDTDSIDGLKVLTGFSIKHTDARHGAVIGRLPQYITMGHNMVPLELGPTIHANCLGDVVKVCRVMAGIYANKHDKVFMKYTSSKEDVVFSERLDDIKDDELRLHVPKMFRVPVKLYLPNYSVEHGIRYVQYYPLAMEIMTPIRSMVTQIKERAAHPLQLIVKRCLLLLKEISAVYTKLSKIHIMHYADVKMGNVMWSEKHKRFMITDMGGFIHKQGRKWNHPYMITFRSASVGYRLMFYRDIWQQLNEETQRTCLMLSLWHGMFCIMVEILTEAMKHGIDGLQRFKNVNAPLPHTIEPVNIVADKALKQNKGFGFDPNTTPIKRFSEYMIDGVVKLVDTIPDDYPLKNRIGRNTQQEKEDFLKLENSFPWIFWYLWLQFKETKDVFLQCISKITMNPDESKDIVEKVFLELKKVFTIINRYVDHDYRFHVFADPPEQDFITDVVQEYNKKDANGKNLENNLENAISKLGDIEFKPDEYFLN